MDPVQKAVINHTFGVSLVPKKKQVISCNVCHLRFNSDVSVQQCFPCSLNQILNSLPAVDWMLQNDHPLCICTSALGLRGNLNVWSTFRRRGWHLWKSSYFLLKLSDGHAVTWTSGYSRIWIWDAVAAPSGCWSSTIAAKTHIMSPFQIDFSTPAHETTYCIQTFMQFPTSVELKLDT